jgi:putative Mg2+ transporter-C (MgtC) family protein
VSVSGQLVVLGQVLAAMVLGGVVGFEREVAHKPAGLRTHMLVAGGAALLVSLSGTLIHTFGGAPLIRADPVRIVQSIVLGISFVAGGTIIGNREAGVEGLTTATSLLIVAAVGIAVAVQAWLLAVGATLLAVAVLRGMGLLERRIRRH